MTIQVDVAELTGLLCESILFGLFVSQFILTIRILVFAKSKHDAYNWPMIVAAVVMMLLAIGQIIADTINIFRAFIPLTRDERILYMEDVTEPIFAAKHALYFTMMIVGDWIVIYRAFVIWGRNYWVAIIPLLCSIGSGISAYQTIWAVRHIVSVTIAAETAWGLAVLSLSLIANLLATSLIAYKIWSHNHAMASSFGTRTTRRTLMPVVRIVVESGTLNAAYLLAYLIVLKSGSHALEIMAGISTPLIGLIFSAVIIRATKASEKRSAPTTNANTSVPLAVYAHSSQHTAVDFNGKWSQHSQSEAEPAKVEV